jgi:hypothetical protein
VPCNGLHTLHTLHTAPAEKDCVSERARPLHSRAAMKNTPFVFAVFLQLVACASESGTVSTADDTGASGLSRSRTVASLTSEEASRLCDWSLETEGGAGKKFECTETSSRVVHTKDECIENVGVISKLSDCYALTVAEVEDCSKEEGADPCGRSRACDALNARLEQCAGKD